MELAADRAEWSRCLVISDGEVDRAFRSGLENSAFTLQVENGAARITWKIDLATPEYAERHLNTFLGSFEADMLLQSPPHARRELRLVQVYMRSGQVLAYGPEMTLHIVGPVAEANHRAQYPWLHHRYESVPLIAALIERYQMYRNRKEALAVVGYFCLSALEHTVPDPSSYRGIRDAFCNHFRVSRDVRNTFGDLVSEVGTLATARKIGPKHDLRVLTAHEVYWLETAMRLLIDRAGRLALGEALPDELAMIDLPLLGIAT